METPETAAERAALVTARDTAWMAWWRTPDHSRESVTFAQYMVAVNALIAHDHAHPVPIPRTSPAAATFEATGTIERLPSQMPEPTQPRPDDAD